MRCHPLRVLVLICAALLGACVTAPLRIDATSPETFAESHSRMMRSLSTADQTRLMLAENIIRVAATPAQASGSQAEIVPLEAVRTELDRKTFAEILDLSKTKKVNIRVRFITQPTLT